MRPSFWKVLRQSPLLSLMSCLLLFVSLPVSAAPRSVEKLEVGSFNLQVFGESKVNKPHVIDPVIQILARYDIVFIQEIRDDKGHAIYKLLDKLRAYT
ncbi:MAG: hypothetical protein EOP09_12320, partial [Proteobacteria bacterium]